MNDRLFRRVIEATSPFDALDLLTTVAALQMLPANINRTVCLEVLAHAIATHAVVLMNSYSGPAPAAAAAGYRTAIALQPQFAPAYSNLADLLRAIGRDAERERVLRDGLGVVPLLGRPSLKYALGCNWCGQSGTTMRWSGCG